MNIFGLTITKTKKKEYKVYNNDCSYCPHWEYRSVAKYNEDIIFGYCSEKKQLTNNKMKHCKYKN